MRLVRRGIEAFIAAILLATMVTSCAKSPVAKVTPASFAHDDSVPPFNQLILAEAAAYPTDGTHTYWWPRKGDGPAYDGCSTDVFLGGTKVMEGESQARTYCCGLTLEVFTKVYDEYLRQNPKYESPLTAGNWAEFQSRWFVRDLQGDGPGDALESLGIGRKISAAEALPGDFVQVWRHKRKKEKNPSGHSVIFLAWEKDRHGNTTGLRYWSTQQSTKGIHERVEKIGNKPGEVDAAHTHYSRATPSASAGK
ncbi:hypothetical protein IT570_08015 [Candidatus Sumerlaeota bacterium]|nr:hypothetical protein [Candidatus Sumerlaeota bacterium]